jgi:hypothetical protein
VATALGRGFKGLHQLQQAAKPKKAWTSAALGCESSPTHPVSKLTARIVCALLQYSPALVVVVVVRFLRVTSMIIVAVVSAYSLWMWLHPPQAPNKITFLDLSTETMALYQSARSDTDQFFQIGVLLLGGFWTVVVVGKDTKIRPGDSWEIISLALTCVTFILFFSAYQNYRDIFSQMWIDFFSIKRIANPSDPFIKAEQSLVAKSFYMAVAASALTVLSLSIFRKLPPEVKCAASQ